MAPMALWAGEPIVPQKVNFDTTVHICTLSDVQFCASARASACGKSKQANWYVLMKLVYRFAM